MIDRLRAHLRTQGRALYWSVEDGSCAIWCERARKVVEPDIDLEKTARSLGLVGEQEVVEPDPLF